MKIYLAGGVTGNLHRFWKEAMKIYLAGTYSRPYVYEQAMKIFLAENAPWKTEGIYDGAIAQYKPYILESFYYIEDGFDWLLKLREHFKGFLLDSGAFSFLNNLKQGDRVDWDSYIDRYGDYINKWGVEKYFELDIDPVVGLKRVEKLRDRLERITGRQSIPVWHKARGLDYWKWMIDNYKHVSIGGIVTREIKPEQYDVFIPLLQMAKEKGVLVHGLGFTRLDKLSRYRFDSVDSTAWLYGNRGGFLYRFNGTGLDKYISKGKKMKGRAAAAHNFTEWLKFSEWAESNL